MTKSPYELGERLGRLAALHPWSCSRSCACSPLMPALPAPRPATRSKRGADHGLRAAGGRTASTLGTERQGSGVVIDDSGLILTIGYLVVEAAEIEIDGAGPEPIRPRSSPTITRAAWAGARPIPGAGADPARASATCRPGSRSWWSAGPASSMPPGSTWSTARLRRLLGVPARGCDLHRAAARPVRRRRPDRRGRAPGRHRLAVGQRRRFQRPSDPGQHVRADRPPQADHGRSA